MKPAVNKGIDERLFNIIVETNSKAPFYNLCGIYTKTLGSGCAEMAVQTEPRHGNPLGITHGGLVTTVADASMGNAVRSTGRMGVTASCEMQFISSADVGQEMVAHGKVVKAGRKLIFVSSEVFSGDQLVAVGQATFYVVGEIHLDQPADK